MKLVHRDKQANAARVLASQVDRAQQAARFRQRHLDVALRRALKAANESPCPWRNADEIL